MRAHTEENYRTEYRYRLPGKSDYDWFIVDVTAFGYNDAGQITSYICLCRNNTIWKQAVEDMRQLRDEAESASRLKSIFLENISHEIRTPLNSIIGFSEIICDEPSAKERANYRKIIKKNNAQLLHVVDSVLVLSQLESGKVDFNLTPLDLSEFFKSQTSFLRSMLPASVELICECDEPVKVVGDTFRFKEIITSLVQNAAKFTTEGSVTIRYKRQNDGLYVSVTDTGIGIARKDQERIFNGFEKVDTFKDGVGVGLAICKAIVEKANGHIGVESELGKGSTFWFWIPCEIS